MPKLVAPSTIPICYRQAFYPNFLLSPVSSAYIFTLIECSTLLGRLYLFTSYALRCSIAYSQSIELPRCCLDISI